MEGVPAAAAGFSPLDEELQLLPGRLSPWLEECLVRLGAWMPFEQAARMLEGFTGVRVSEYTARQHSEAAGAAQVARQTEEVERLEREAPAEPAGPVQQLLSADGAFVPLVGREWAEVKTVVIGEVEAPRWEAKQQEWEVYTGNLSYFSRLADAERFSRLALVETQRRGVGTAAQVGAVQDGADWLQGFVDYHRPDAVRILDFPHAAGYVSQIGQVEFGADSPEQAAWLKGQLHELKQRGPEEVLRGLHEVVGRHPEAEALPKALAYLEKRREQLDYPTFQAQGWPIGSGAVESGNKLVVEARLKGAGMHWARERVDPMLALRNIVCNDRWSETWPGIEARLRQQARQGRLARRHRGGGAPVEPEPVPAGTQEAGPPTPCPDRAPPRAAEGSPEPGETPRVPGRPSPNHPWRHAPVGRARYHPAGTEAAGKL